MIGIVVPAFNCGNSVERLIPEILKLDLGPVFLIDDASDQRIRIEDRSCYALQLIRNKRNLGYSHSVVKGMGLALCAGCSAIATIDGDAAHRTEDLASLARSWRMDPNALLIGDRMASNSFMQLATKQLANQVSSALVSLCFGGDRTQGRDVSSGLRIYSSDFAQSIIEKHVERFGLCYLSIFWSLKFEQAVRWLPIEVRYPPMEFQFTKQVEFLDLLTQLEAMNTMNFDLSKVAKLVGSKISFNVVLAKKMCLRYF